MDNSLNVKILESYINIDKLHDAINEKIFLFITKASDLVELSEDMFQIEKNILLNKISIKEYVLDSPCCILLKENNISNYSIEELREYLNKYAITTNEDCSSYLLALSLYELLEEIEKTVDNKISIEIKMISELTTLIEKIKNTNEYDTLYKEMQKELEDKYLNQNLIDDKSLGICIQIINDIFNFYVNGYPNILDE